MRNPQSYGKQTGVVLFAALIALVVLLIAAVALLRSTDTAQMIAGNLAVKRDLTHESEAGVQAALAQFTGTLAAEGARWADIAGSNYSAVALASNNQGIPNVLISAPLTGEPTTFTNGVTYRYVIDRLCPKTGAPDLQHCVTGSSVADTTTSSNRPGQNGQKGTPKADGTVVYRISVRVTDARKTQSFFQTTLKSTGS
jgi:type IV pilus assembly protein PilX